MVPQWSSPRAFLAALLGSAIGLGNIWSLPIVAATHGGLLFWILYGIALLLMALPLLITELALGRLECRSPTHTLRTLTRQHTCSPIWEVVAWGGGVTGLLILSFYSVIAGWMIAFALRSLGHLFDGQRPEAVAQIFAALVEDPERQLAWHTLFCGLVIAIIGQDLRRGLEGFNQVAVPLLLLILMVLLGYVLNSPHFDQATRLLFAPDWSRFTLQSVELAFSHAFFSVTLGLGVMMAFGAYLQADVPIAKLATLAVVIDTAVALIAGLALIPILLDQQQPLVLGPTLLFHALPSAFGALPTGAFWGSLLFLMIFLVTLTSAIALTEPTLAWLADHQISRHNGAWILGGLCWLMGLATILSFHPTYAAWVSFKGQTFFEWANQITAHIMLPLGALLILIFAGWVIQPATFENQLGGGPLFRLWRLNLRFILPLLLLLLLLTTTGVVEWSTVTLR